MYLAGSQKPYSLSGESTTDQPSLHRCLGLKTGYFGPSACGSSAAANDGMTMEQIPSTTPNKKKHKRIKKIKPKFCFEYTDHYTFLVKFQKPLHNSKFSNKWNIFNLPVQ